MAIAHHPIVARRRRHPPLSLSSIVKNPHLRILPVTSADSLCKIYPQFTQMCNIRVPAHLHFTIAPDAFLQMLGEFSVHCQKT